MGKPIDLSKVTAFGLAVQGAMHLKGLTQTEVAERVGCTQSVISTLVNGGTKLPRGDTLHLIGAQVGLSAEQIDDLLGHPRKGLVLQLEREEAAKIVLGLRARVTRLETITIPELEAKVVRLVSSIDGVRRVKSRPGDEPSAGGRGRARGIQRARGRRNPKTGTEGP